jgi:hypothetical protein
MHAAIVQGKETELHAMIPVQIISIVAY